MYWIGHPDIFSEPLLVAGKIGAATTELNVAASIKNCFDPAILPIQHVLDIGV